MNLSGMDQSGDRQQGHESSPESSRADLSGLQPGRRFALSLQNETGESPAFACTQNMKIVYTGSAGWMR